METRPGLRTTEFWLALAVVILGALATTFSTEPWAQIAGTIAAALSAAGYSFARTAAKRGAQ
jgi:hypothetical protein